VKNIRILRLFTSSFAEEACKKETTLKTKMQMEKNSVKLQIKGKTGRKNVDWLHVAQDKEHWRARVNTL
jgi:hypothetical protein